jgi:RNA polymerase sigma-70 factor (ECF subfamily)
MKTNLSFEELVGRYHRTLSKIAATFEADAKLQQDLLQEILLSLWQALGRFKGDSKLHTYVYRVAYNRALNHVTKQSRMPQHSSIDEHHFCQQPGPEQDTKEQQQLNQLLFAIRQLPIIQRQLVILSLDGMSYDDIAAITGLTTNNVGVKLNRAKKALKDILIKNFGDK